MTVELSIIDPSSGSDQSLSASAVGGGAPPAQTGPESPQARRAESSSGAGATGVTASTSQQNNETNEAAMIMDGLETMSFSETHVNFHHLLNFENFKPEMPDDSASVAGIVRRSEPNSINDSLNTPVSGFMDFPIFFGPSVVLPIPSALTGKIKRPSVRLFFTTSLELNDVTILDGCPLGHCCLRRFLAKTVTFWGKNTLSINRGNNADVPSFLLHFLFQSLK